MALSSNGVLFNSPEGVLYFCYLYKHRWFSDTPLGKLKKVCYEKEMDSTN